jgi:fibrillarin-like rRNA methylase
MAAFFILAGLVPAMTIYGVEVSRRSLHDLYALARF